MGTKWHPPISLAWTPSLSHPLPASTSLRLPHGGWAGAARGDRQDRPAVSLRPGQPPTPASLFLPPLVFASIRAFSDDSGLCIRWPKYWNFSFGISPSNEYSGLISFRIDWLDVLAIQGTLKSLPQQHNWKASVFQCSVFFMVQLHTYCSLLQARSCRRRLGYSENPHN